MIFCYDCSHPWCEYVNLKKRPFAASAVLRSPVAFMPELGTRRQLPVPVKLWTVTTSLRALIDHMVTLSHVERLLKMSWRSSWGAPAACAEGKAARCTWQLFR